MRIEAVAFQIELSTLEIISIIYQVDISNVKRLRLSNGCNIYMAQCVFKILYLCHVYSHSLVKYSTLVLFTYL